MKILFMIVAAGCLLSIHPQSVAEKVMETELSFSKLSVSSGIKASFLAFLSDSCVMYNNEVLVNGKSLYEKRSGEEKNTLEWYPTYITAPEDGNLALSTGVYKLSTKENGTVLSEGRFYTIWQKEKDGYKVLFDGGGETNENFAGFEKSKLIVSPVSGTKKSQAEFEKFFEGFKNNLLSGKIEESTFAKDFIVVSDGQKHLTAEELNSTIKIHKNVSNIKTLTSFFCESGKLAAVAGNFVSLKYKNPIMFFAVFSLQNDKWVMNCLTITE
jgi:ketosteroid isomerase-like protein